MSWKSAIGTDVFDLDIMMNYISFPNYYPPYNSSSTTFPGPYSLGSGGGPAGYNVDFSRWLAIVPKALQQVAMSIVHEAARRSQSYNGNYGGLGGYYGYNGPPFDVNMFWGNVAQIIDTLIKSGALREPAGDGNDILKGML